jgi:hypothetical protein
VNAVQAQTAADPALRAHYAAIAADELAHAALAHAIAYWLEGVLSPDDRTRVHAERETAAHELAITLDTHATDATRAPGCRPAPSRHTCSPRSSPRARLGDARTCR